MSSVQPLRTGLGILALIGGVLAGMFGHLLLMASLFVLACVAFWESREVWSYVLVGVAALALAFSLPTLQFRGDPLALLGGVIWVCAMGALLLNHHSTRTQVAQMRNVIQALEKGSAELAQARDSDGIIRAGIQTLEKLDAAPNLAFVAFRRGTPHILGARGAFQAHLEQPILPSEDDSRSVQADHWVAEEALSLIPRAERVHFLNIPVIGHAGQQIGFLLLARRVVPGTKVADFEPETKGVVAAFARLFGSALGQWQAIRELRDANDLTLRSLGAALEHRDDDTGGHTARVVDLSIQLARRLGWKEDRIKALQWGAYLHDLGKLAIPDAILYKPTHLTPDERRIIQQHTTVGYDMLQDLHFLPAETLDLVRYHHERWDGKGYPSRLSGQDIPSTARIFSIVDVYDALISSRPYKEAWTRERALAEIKVQAGRQFDPQFVDAFLNMMQEKDDARLVL
ncbi:HD-GYP domain-containing protein [Deinococcus sp. KNUC1210]|uniref:HD-GYP domain-containing protein n=1 Tax=Deinococcus sp. KNUC1210 TaxID=2917691 RepID=UPI001EF14D6D|nr:HD-GYP domain-containing protein [Deinococcus sp. KNUC1210]ULH16256.1 HD-GYP domain-containing protein [Deinococcus sp. KNUC1210]